MLIPSPKELALLAINQRKKLKVSQADVGKCAGLKQQTISEFEIKPERTKVQTLFRILSALNLEINVLVKEEAINKSDWNEEW